MNPPTKPTSDNLPRVVCGGGWNCRVSLWVRAASRYSFEPAYRVSFIGFRCALRGREPRT